MTQILNADIDSRPVQCTMKVNPDEIEKLKTTYQAVGKPYNFCPAHWVSLTAGMDILDSMILDMIKDSYNLVKK